MRSRWKPPAGFAGIRYWVRHDPAQKLHGVALFGPAGATSGPQDARGISEAIPEELIEQGRARFGYRIVPRP
jgi:hypothetical protein